jgi:hypothetical protein
MKIKSREISVEVSVDNYGHHGSHWKFYQFCDTEFEAEQVAECALKYHPSSRVIISRVYLRK